MSNAVVLHCCDMRICFVDHHDKIPLSFRSSSLQPMIVAISTTTISFPLSVPGEVFIPPKKIPSKKS